MKTKKTSILSIAIFKIVKFFVRLFYGKTEIIGMENLPENNAIIVSNHAKMNGPIIGELFMPENSFTWCAGEMMKTKDVPSYAFRDFWSGKGKWSSPFYKGLSYIISPSVDVLPAVICDFMKRNHRDVFPGDAFIRWGRLLR